MTNNVKELTLYELIRLEVTESQRSHYRDEIRRRLEDQPLVDYLKNWKAPAAVYNRSSTPNPRRFEGMGQLAEEMLNSEYGFDDLKMPRDNAMGLLKTIRDGNLSEAEMSDAQLGAFSAIKGKYRQFKIGRAQR